MPLTQSRSFDNNAGLGLGLPSTFASTSAGRSASAKTITASTSAHFDDSYLFPMPSKSRAVSAETVRVSINEISYWSPNSEEEYEDDDEDCQSEEDYGEVVESSPESQLLATPEEASPLVAPHMKLEAHACLHLLSPKVDAFAQAVMNQGFSSDEAVESALEWAWLVPMVGKCLVYAGFRDSRSSLSYLFARLCSSDRYNFSGLRPATGTYDVAPSFSVFLRLKHLSRLISR